MITRGVGPRTPPLLLLDEPTSALDLAHQVQVMWCIRAYAEGQGAPRPTHHSQERTAANVLSMA